ncbi:MAG: calcium/sodium antiporter [Actinomycetota bacterium]
MALSILALVAGLVMLTWCADMAVRAAETVSEHLGVSPVIVGALVVGLGTSLPEMVVSGIAAAQRDTIDLAIGNVLGSNAANLSLVLGIGAVITAISGSRDVMRREGALMLLSTLLFGAFVIDGTLTRWEGVVLLVGMAVAAVLVARGPGTEDVPGAPGAEPGEVTNSIVRAIVGLIGVLVGAQLMVTGAVDIAEEFGASEAFIGLTVVAIGTSLPELATTVASARRGAVDLIIGNVLGSNLFNALAVAGLAGVLGNGVIEESVTPSLIALGVVSLFVVGWGVVRHSFQRGVGLLLLAAYAVILILGA